MIKTVLLVPVRDNAGRDFPRSAWIELERRFRQLGGFTRATDVQGEWEDEGEVYRDRSRQYVVVLPSWERLAEWLVVVRWAQAAFAQRAMYIEVAGIPEILTGSATAPEPGERSSAQ